MCCLERLFLIRASLDRVNNAQILKLMTQHDLRAGKSAMAFAAASAPEETNR